jgi:hypothetical protein
MKLRNDLGNFNVPDLVLMFGEEIDENKIIEIGIHVRNQNGLDEKGYHGAAVDNN